MSELKLGRREALGTMASLGAMAGLGTLAVGVRPAAAAEPTLLASPLIARIWHGRTPAAKADEYATYLFEAGIKNIAAVQGNRGAQMMRGDNGDESEFMVISYWD